MHFAAAAQALIYQLCWGPGSGRIVTPDVLLHLKPQRTGQSGQCCVLSECLTETACMVLHACWRFAAWLQAAGTHRGVAGFGAGLNLGLRLARPLASFTFRLMPQLSVAAAVLPSLAPVLRNALRCSCSLMAMGVAATTAAGLLGGGVLGFCCGTVGVVRFTAKLSCHAAAVAAKVAAGFSRAALPRALALMLLKGGRVLQLHMLGQRKALQAPLA